MFQFGNIVRALADWSPASPSELTLQGYNFTDRVRRILQIAREHAHRLGHEYVETEHILLGILTEGDGVAATVLANLKSDLNALPAMIEAIIPPGVKAIQSGPDLPYTSNAKKTLEGAMVEARELHHSYVGSEHLLLGILRNPRNKATGILNGLGVTVEAARAETTRLLGTSEMQADGPTSPPPDMMAAFRDVRSFAEAMSPGSARVARQARLIAIVALIVAAVALALTLVRVR